MCIRDSSNVRQKGMISTTDIIDLSLIIIGCVTVIFLIINIRKSKPKVRGHCIFGIILSVLAGYGWSLMSIFIFPSLMGAQMNFSPHAEPLPLMTEISFRQAIPGGVMIAILGLFLTFKLGLRINAEQDAAGQSATAE